MPPPKGRSDAFWPIWPETREDPGATLPGSSLAARIADVLRVLSLTNYFPTPGGKMPATATRPGVTLERRRGERRALVTPDGIRIEAEHLPPGDGSRDLAVVLAHGFTLHSRHPAVRQVAAWLAAAPDGARARVGVVLVDLRGHGGSGGRSTVGDAEVHDVAAAVQWARVLGYRRVATLGFSLGAAVVLRHAALHADVDAVAAVSGPGQWYFRGTAPMRLLHRGVETRMGRAALGLLWRTRVSARQWVPPYPLDPAEAVASIEVPLLLVHGRLDPYFPVDHAVALDEAADGRAELWLEDDYGHAESALSQALAGRIGAWLQAATTACGGGSGTTTGGSGFASGSVRTSEGSPWRA